ncbi:MAG: PulJ/GspJ family protein [Acidiferrobacter sp.]
MRPRNAGFTLLEVIVALAIFVAAASVMLEESSNLLQSAIRAHAQLRQDLALQDAVALTEATARSAGSLATPVRFGLVTIQRRTLANLVLPDPTGMRRLQKIRLVAPHGRTIVLWVQR